MYEGVAVYRVKPEFATQIERVHKYAFIPFIEDILLLTTGSPHKGIKLNWSKKLLINAQS